MDPRCFLDPHDRAQDASGFWGPTYSRAFPWCWGFFASIGGSVFRYDAGAISGALILLGGDLGHHPATQINNGNKLDQRRSIFGGIVN